MEADDSRVAACNKRPRQAKLSGNGDRGGDNDDDEADRKNKMLRPWHLPASRIFRVSRASGGKDRHSKVYTSKGLRDRRVRLSVSTAIQFYDIQDRLGYDQPSKAIEWLIKAAASAIAELPSLDSTFGTDAEAALKQDVPNAHSSASETSKVSVLSLSRTESRVKARDTAAKEKVDGSVLVAQNLNPTLNSQSSFTELLTGRGTPASVAAKNVVTSTADYFGTESGLFAHHNLHHQQQQQQQQRQKGATFASHFGNSSSPTGMLHFGNAEHHHHRAEMQQFAFLAQQHDHFFPIPAASAAASGGGDHYNLNFSISSPLAGVHRGTLQSNSPSHHHLYHHNHQSSQLDGSGVIPFLFSTAATNENHYSSGFDGHLQLCDGYKHLELKGKGKG